MFLIFDTETTGLPRNANAPLTDFDNWPRLVQLAWQVHDYEGKLVEVKSFIIKPEGFTIPYNAEQVHGISTQMALTHGEDLDVVLESFSAALKKSTHVAGHNTEFDLKITGSELLRKGLGNLSGGKVVVDTMVEATQFCALPGGRGGGFKYPTLSELHQKLFAEPFTDAHNAAADVVATARCFLELIRLGVLNASLLELEKPIVENFRKLNPAPFQPIDIKIVSHKKVSEKLAREEPEKVIQTGGEILSGPEQEIPFTHLHVHSYYSVLQATPSIEGLIAKAQELNMPAIALTDHGNLFGAYAFIKTASKNKIKPIVGCEFYLVQDRTKQQFTRDNPDRRYLQVLLAKNYEGYRNLSRLSSIAWLEGSYGQYPRIDKEILVKYKDNLIATTGGMQSEVCDLILNVGESQAEEAFKWWKEQFGDDFYIQINRHGLEEERRVNQVLMDFASKYKVKYFAANNVYYLEKEDSNLHDSLICIQNNEYQSTPIGRGRDRRFGFPNDEFYLKSKEEMANLFQDLPAALTTIQEIVDKIKVYKLDRDPLMPDFPIPSQFADADEYLRHLTYEGAKKRYSELTPSLIERIDYELNTIKKMGYPGYFLIVQDFLNEARNMGVWVGPGRGSAAGSVVAYALRITDVDPIKYDLLFERFLNPDRVSLPDIDIDFDEDGREKVLKWVVDKYGANRVAHIITFGKMQPKMAIRDVARVKQLPLPEANRLAKLVPPVPGTTFKTAYKSVPELEQEKSSRDPLVRETLMSAEKIEGTIRNVGTHACGIIIGKEDLIDHIPVSTFKDSELLVTQFEGTHIGEVGMLKMDFLGLKTLSIIKDAIENIKSSRNYNIDIDNIPLDDPDTYKLFSKGDTTAIFQFESEPMKRHLRELKPNRFADLIAMNALYRPGPMEYIPTFIKRKNGREKVEYDFPVMQEILEETYGVTVYQEQVMRLSQLLGGFTGGEADTLRKAMGKKSAETLNKLNPKFLEGAAQRNFDPKKIEKIWNDWKEFAKYAFNKSHSTCYAILAYKMAYLKTHFPAEFMAAVLSRNLNDISKITFFIDEAKHMGINVLKPDVNESGLNFIVNSAGEIRFGLAAIKGLGSSAVEAIITERTTNGPFISIFDFAKRINMRIVNKRSFEALAMAGAFDSFENTHRAQFFHRENTDDTIFIEKVMRYGAKYQERKLSQQVSLFQETTEDDSVDPPMPECKPWSRIEQVQKEKEITGFYISGHPLDEYRVEMKNFSKHSISQFKDNLKAFKNRPVVFGGMVISAEHKLSQNNKPFGSFVLEDFEDTIELRLFSEEYLKFRHLLSEGFFLLIYANIQERFKMEDQYEVKITNIVLLPEVIEKQTREIRLRISIEDLTENTVEQIASWAKEFKGDCRVAFNVYDTLEKLNLNFKANNLRVKAPEFLRFIDSNPDFSYQLS